MENKQMKVNVREVKNRCIQRNFIFQLLKPLLVLIVVLGVSLQNNSEKSIL